MSLTVIFLPTAKQKTVTPSYSKNNIPTKTNRKHLNHQQQHDGVTFHLVLTVSNFSKLNQRCIESIFYFHPTSHVILHSNAEIRFVPQGNDTTTNIPQRLEQTIKQLTHRGYDIEILPYTAKDILQTAMTTSNSLVNQTLAKEWMSQIRTRYRHEKYWYSNESNLLRLCILYVQGGIYLDTDVILVRPMYIVEPTTSTNSMKNTITDYNGLDVDNVMARDGKSFECAVMKFIQPNNVFLGHAINNFLSHYNGVDWGNNGPRVFGRTSKEMPWLVCPEPYNYTTTDTNTTSHANCSMQPLPSIAFQPIPWRNWYQFCFDSRNSPVGINATNIIQEPNVYAVHMNNHAIGDAIERNLYVKNSVCDIVLTQFCILCEP
jgi:Glycosyltransferase sugar-binding region containing DXD motif/Alpha 1,4-glycosyltransferase conserved region